MVRFTSPKNIVTECPVSLRGAPSEIHPQRAPQKALLVDAANLTFINQI